MLAPVNDIFGKAWLELKCLTAMKSTRSSTGVDDRPRRDYTDTLLDMVKDLLLTKRTTG